MSDEGLVTATTTAPKHHHHPLALWLKVRTAYIHGEGALPAISARFHIPLTTLQSKAKAEKWTDDRKRYLDSQRLHLISAPTAQTAQPTGPAPKPLTPLEQARRLEAHGLQVKRDAAGVPVGAVPAVPARPATTKPKAAPPAVEDEPEPEPDFWAPLE